MVTWLKWKYRRPKVTGRYRSSHNDQGKSGRSASGPTDYIPAEWTVVYDAARGRGVLKRVRKIDGVD